MRTKITLLTLTLIAIFSFTKVNAQFTGPAPLWTTAGGDMFGFGGIMPNFTIDVNGNINLNGAYKYGGADFLKLSNIDNILLGINAGTGTTGRYNVFVGNNAGANNIGGKSNSFFGYDAGNANQGGQKNTFIGYNTGYLNTSENYNSYFGFNAYGAAGISNATAIGSNAYVAQSNSLVLGGTGTYAVKVGIGTSTPAYTLDVTGDIRSTSLAYSGTNFVFADNNGHLMIGTPSTYGTNWLTMGNYATNPLSQTTPTTGTDYIGTADAKDFIIGTNGTKQIHIVGVSSGFGNVGIGFATIVSPSYKLDVVGDINISSTLSAYKYGGSDFLKLLGTNNVLLGVGAGVVTTSTGTNNTFLGNNAGNANTNGVENTYVGSSAGYSLIGSSSTWYTSFNTCVGYKSGYGGPTNNGQNNTFIGHKAGYSLTTGQLNTFIGFESGYNNATQTPLAGGGSGDQIGNTFIGSFSGHDNNLGFANVFSGFRAGYTNTVGQDNCFYGLSAGESNINGSGNTIIGDNAGTNGRSSGSSTCTTCTTPIPEQNVFLGSGSGQYYSGGANTFLGANTVSSGGNNVLIGYNATAGNAKPGTAPTTGTWYNVTNSISMGFYANVTANNSIAIGDHSNITNCTSCSTTVVTNSMAIGSYATVSSPSTGSLTNATAIGANSNVTTSNTMVLGSSISSSPYWTDVVIGNTGSTSTSYILEVNGDAYTTGSSWHTSDKRFKTNIEDFKNAKEIIKLLHPVKYEYRDDIYFTKIKGDTTPPVKMRFSKGEQIGFIAQELQQHLPQAVMEGKDGYLAVNYNHLFGVIVKGIQEQDSDITLQKIVIDSLINQNSSLNNSVNELNKRLSALEQGINTNQIQMNGSGLGKIGTKSNELFSNNSSSNSTSYLQQNVPNPFKEITTIEYYLTTNTQKASLLIFSMNGALLKTIQINQFTKGTVQISGGELKPGMCFYSLIADDKEVDTKKMIILE